MLLEAEWVLRAAYKRPRALVLQMLRAFLGLPNLAAEDLGVAITALAWAEQGMDFADALHLGASAACAGFATLDRDLAAHAARMAGAIPVHVP